MNELLLILAIFFPLAACPVFFLLEKFGFRPMGLISSAISLFSLVCVTSIWLPLAAGETIIVNIPWVPHIGINISFIVDGLSLFFGILVAGMGVLVNFYANYYMEPSGRFYCCMTFFMAAMLGTVFADDLMVLYIFWELTGLASFLLIGYHRSSGEASQNARLSLLVTFLTGMFLFIGILLIGFLDETYQWSEIIAKGINFSGHDFWAYPIIVFFLIGIFGKSAQLPFHFWLPKAMVAPIPVSSYLHAATMVKLGIFLTARMYPLFVTIDGWFPLVTTVCYATMLFGAVLSLLSNDLKELLAYATISQLGFFIGFYGMGGPEGVRFDFVHIFNHALYKGSLFMWVGIITMATGIRDIRYLGGLWKRLPLMTVGFFLAAAAMAGIPGTTGFLSKELILTDLLGRELNTGTVVIFIILISAMTFKVAFSLRLFFHVFIRRTGEKPFDVVKPGLLIQLSPLLLSFLAFLFGVWPAGLNFLVGRFFVSALHLEEIGSIQLLHGWQYETFISFAILIAGGLLFYLAEKTQLWWMEHPFPDWGGAWERLFNRIPEVSDTFTSFIHRKKQNVYLGILMIGFAVIIGYSLSDSSVYQSFSFDPIRILTSVFAAVSAFFAILFRDRMGKLLSLSLSGFLVTLYFILYAAPDLAMTQLLVEVVTLLILLMVFSTIRHEPLKMGRTGRVFRVSVSLIMGGAAAWCCWAFNGASADQTLPAFFFKNSLELAKGSNVVNTILVDFRGLDTLGEVAVLVIASLGVWGMLHLETDLKSPVALIPSVILKAMIPFIFVLVNVFSIYLLLRGHDLPGGGFISGLASGISIILLCMIYQTNRIITISRLEILRTAILGLLLMVAVASLPLLTESTLLTHFPWKLNTPLVFDIGVYFAVLGVTIRIFFSMRTKLIGEAGHAL